MPLNRELGLALKNNWELGLGLKISWELGSDP